MKNNNKTMNNIKRFDQLNEETLGVVGSDENSIDDITVEDIINYLSTLPSDTSVYLSSGWNKNFGKTPLEIIKNTGIFDYHESQGYININNR